jgi:SAM-dependent methyltransferase
MPDYLNRILSYTPAYLVLQKVLGSQRLRRICVDVLAPRAGERILDVGCGPAYILEYLPSVEYYGFDTERRHVNYARRKYRTKGRFYCEKFTEAHLESFEPVDAVIFIGLLHHLTDDACHEILDLASRVLKVAGRVVTLDPCYVPGQSIIARFVAAHDRGRFVRDRQSYLALAEHHFDSITEKIVSNVGRVPSTEIIMRLDKPKVKPRM